jgi:hypothetical protein
MPGLVAPDVGDSLIPDDHRAGAARVAAMNTLEIPCGHRVVLDGHSEPPYPGVKRRSLGHRPRAQHLTRLDTEVVVQPRGVVQLHDEPRRRDQHQRVPNGGSRVQGAGAQELRGSAASRISLIRALEPDGHPGVPVMALRENFARKRRFCRTAGVLIGLPGAATATTPRQETG